MKKHDETCKNCVSTEGDEYCFNDLKNMLNYHKAQQSWYEKLWDTVYYPIYRVGYKLRYLHKDIKWFVQRGKRNYGDDDVWSTCDTLATLIPSMIADMRKDLVGVPVSMYKKLDADGHATNAEQKRAEKRWDKVLESIQTAFEIEQKILDGEILDFTAVQIKKNNEWLSRHCKEYDVTVITTKERRIRKKGWENFQAYFHNLWI